MSKIPVPDTDHIVRYVGPSKIDGDIVDASAFALPANKDELSAHWLEFFAELDKEARLVEVRCLSRLELKKNGRFVELNVGRTVAHLVTHAALSFIQDPLDADDKHEEDRSHCSIRGLPAHNSETAELIGDMIAECIVAKHAAVLD